MNSSSLTGDSATRMTLTRPTAAPVASRPPAIRSGHSGPDWGRLCAPHRHAQIPIMASANAARRRRLRQRGYPSDLSDAQWQRLQPLLFGKNRSRTTDLRAVLDAINYRWRCGCAWRMLPHDFPPWETVYGYFRAWRKAGLLSGIRALLLQSRRSNLQGGIQPDSP